MKKNLMIIAFDVVAVLLATAGTIDFLSFLRGIVAGVACMGFSLVVNDYIE